MSVSRKLFYTMAVFIIAMSMLFAFVTQIVIRDSLNLMVESTRKRELNDLSQLFVRTYKTTGGSWSEVKQIKLPTKYENSSVLLLSTERKLLFRSGETDERIVKRFGVSRKLQSNGKTIGYLYYSDVEVNYLSKLRIGINDSTMVLLFLGAVTFICLSLLVAFWLAKRLTAPLRMLVTSIDRVGEGEFGVQVSIKAKDEYGKVASAFNQMSTQLRQAETARKNLVADVAHELRTPLTIIQGQLDFLQQKNQSIAPQALLPMQDELIRLNRLIDDLHQLTLAEAKKLPLERKPTEIPDLLRRIIHRVNPEAEKKQIKIQLICRQDTTSVFIDRNRMTQVFLNLLTNAVHYTPEYGTIQITIQADKQFSQIAIADSGPGITPEHLPLLFNRFYRTDEARTRNQGGMGLGLAIAREFVVAHEGTIQVESCVGQGTTFTVQLPLHDR